LTAEPDWNWNADGRLDRLLALDLHLAAPLLLLLLLLLLLRSPPRRAIGNRTDLLSFSSLCPFQAAFLQTRKNKQKAAPAAPVGPTRAGG
jgi:hypothetical protein